MLDEFDPAGAAAGYHGKNALVGQSMNQFGSFFHDRQIRAEVRVEHVFETDAVQGINQIRSNVILVHAEQFAEGDPHRVRRPASWIGVLFVLQLLLGVFALLVTRGEDRYVNAQDVTSLFPTLHTLNGALLLALATVVAVRSRRVDLDPRRVFA